MKFYLLLIAFSFSVFSKSVYYPPRKVYLGFDAGVSFVEMAKANAPRANTFSLVLPEIDVSEYKPDFGLALGGFVGVEIWDQYMLSPFAEVNFQYIRSQNTDEGGDAVNKTKNINTDVGYMNYSIVHMDATGELGLNLNLRFSKILISPFVTAEYGFSWRRDRVRFSRKNSIFNLSRKSKTNFSNLKLNVGIRFINHRNYFSFIKGTLSNLTPSKQTNVYNDNGNKSDTTTIQYDKADFEDTKNYFSVALGGGVFF